MVTDIYSLPDLTYDPGALEPHISGRIMKLQHDKHHLRANLRPPTAPGLSRSRTAARAPHLRSILEGPSIAVQRVGEEIHHDGKVVRVDALVWDFFAAVDPERTYIVNVSLTVGTQPYTY